MRDLILLRVHKFNVIFHPRVVCGSIRSALLCVSLQAARWWVGCVTQQRACDDTMGVGPSSPLFVLGFASSAVKCCFVIEVFAQGCPITALSRWSAWWTHNLFMKRQGVNPNSRSQTFSPGRWELSGLGSTHRVSSLRAPSFVMTLPRKVYRRVAL